MHCTEVEISFHRQDYVFHASGLLLSSSLLILNVWRQCAVNLKANSRQSRMNRNLYHPL